MRGERLGNDTLTFVPAGARIRCLRDHIIVQPLKWEPSRLLAVESSHKPLRGVVKAVGPGTHPKRYDHHDKHKRTKMWDAKCFRPCDVKVGDIVEMGGLEIGGYMFQSILWGDELHLICREEDVCVVCEDATPAVVNG